MSYTLNAGTGQSSIQKTAPERWFFDLTSLEQLCRLLLRLVPLEQLLLVLQLEPLLLVLLVQQLLPPVLLLEPLELLQLVLLMMIHQNSLDTFRPLVARQPIRLNILCKRP